MIEGSRITINAAKIVMLRHCSSTNDMCYTPECTVDLSKSSTTGEVIITSALSVTATWAQKTEDGYPAYCICGRNSAVRRFTPFPTKTYDSRPVNMQNLIRAGRRTFIGCNRNAVHTEGRQGVVIYNCTLS